MNPRDFLDQAGEWVSGVNEADWRSSVSRAYYAAFHVGRGLFADTGFTVPNGPNSHGYVWLRLANAGRAEIVQIGNALNSLRGLRNRADYDLRQAFLETQGVAGVGMAEDIIRILDELTATPEILLQVVEAIRAYERDVLGEVTWHSR